MLPHVAIVYFKSLRLIVAQYSDLLRHHQREVLSSVRIGRVVVSKPGDLDYAPISRCPGLALGLEVTGTEPCGLSGRLLHAVKIVVVHDNLGPLRAHVKVDCVWKSPN